MLLRASNASLRRGAAPSGCQRRSARPCPLRGPRAASVDTAPAPERPDESVDLPDAAVTPVISLASPETLLTLNGRIAMMGFAAGVAGELLHGQPLGAQLAAAWPQALAVWLLLAAATAVPLLKGSTPDDELFGPFNSYAERANGKLAIVGFLALVAIEAFKGGPLF